MKKQLLISFICWLVFYCTNAQIISDISSTAYAKRASTISIPITIRDFSVIPPHNHPDFDRFSGGVLPGMVQTTLGTDQKPRVKLPLANQLTSEANFNKWFNDDSLNKRKDTFLDLTSAGSGNYSFSSSNYYPINNELWGNEGSPNNKNFTVEMNCRFIYNSVMQQITITSDDDAWLFVNGRLAVDLGGTHGATTGSVTLNAVTASNLGLVLGGAYNIALFKAERSGSGSALGFQTNFAVERSTADYVPDANGVLYVKKESTGDGSSWSNAVGEVTDALEAAKNNTNIKEIWVAKGTYYPSRVSNRDHFFYITRNNLKVYGGFSGTETALSQRNISENVTLLSGDIGVQGSAADNSFHIMIIDALNASIDNSTQVDGFTFQDGNANEGGVFNNYAPRYSGSAILIYPSDYNNSPTISNNIFKNNSQFQTGAVEVESNNTGSNFTKIENCSFSNNYAKYAGGAISVFNYNIGSPQSVQITDCTFEGNSVDNASQGGLNGGVGGAVFVYGGGDVLINRSKFVNNIIGNSTQYMGTYKGTAIAAINASVVTLVNSLIYSDQIYIPLFNSGSTFNIVNSTVYNPDGGTLLATQSPVVNSIRNSIFWMGGNSVNAIDGAGTVVTANNSIILPKYNVTLNGSNNYTTDPLFTNVSTKDFTLKPTSNGINKGNNSYYNSSKYGNLDLANNNRIEETIIDIGAFEQQPTLSSSDIKKENNIRIYPNPVKDIMHFNSDEKILKIEIISMDSRKLIEKNLNEDKKLDVQKLPKGLYLINVFSEKEIQTIKFIKD